MNWYDYGFRFYDPAIGRFPSLDPKADEFEWVSPYNYAENSPIANLDWWGLQKVNFQAIWWEKFSVSVKNETGYDLRLGNLSGYNADYAKKLFVYGYEDLKKTANDVSQSPLMMTLLFLAFAPATPSVLGTMGSLTGSISNLSADAIVTAYRAGQITIDAINDLAYSNPKLYWYVIA
jgi:hypothetical protein